MDLDITGRTVLITGASGGIGEETARQLLAEGARVVITDLDEAGLRHAAERLRGAGGGHGSGGVAAAVAADVTSTPDVERLVRAAEEALGGGVDVLVHTAGTTGATGDFHELDDDGWLATMDLNFFSAVRLCRLLAPRMAERGWGRIVLLASEDPLNAYVDDMPYNASKAALLTTTKGLSKTYGASGVLVNAVSPAFIQTDMTDAMMRERAEKDGTTFEEAVEHFLDTERPGIVLRRRGRVEEVAAVIAFLVSERASFVTGSNYRVDAGSVAVI